MTKVWLAQCLCPQRHCILATAGEADDRAAAEPIEATLRESVDDLIAGGVLNAWCGICHAERGSWRVEIAETPWASLPEALPHLQLSEAENIAAGLTFGELAGALKKATKH